MLPQNSQMKTSPLNQEIQPDVSLCYVPYHYQYQFPVDCTAIDAIPPSALPPTTTTLYQPWSGYSSTPVNMIQPSLSPSPVNSTTSNNHTSRIPLLQSNLDQSPLSPLFPETSTTPPCDTDSGNSSGLSPESSPSLQPSCTSPSSSTKSFSPEESKAKTNSRTNYSPQQMRSLERVFLETPYPESEAMEQMSRDLNIPEKNLKIWFQNKRARWRKRVRDNKPTFPPVNSGYLAPIPTSGPQYSMISPSALMSPMLPSTIGSRSMYNLPPSMPSSVNKAMYQGPVQLPAYITPYMYPQFTY